MRKTSPTTFEVLNYQFNANGGQAALKHGATELTFGDWQEQADRLARALMSSGIGPEDRVAVLTFNCIEQFIILLATMKIGAVYVPVNYRLAPKEIAYVLNQSQSRIVFADTDELVAAVDQVAGETDVTQFVRIAEPEGCAEPWQHFEAYLESGDDQPLDFVPAPETIVYQMYTSGTTGFPKGVLITQQQFASLMFEVQLVAPRLEPGKPHLTVAPLYHAAALVSSVMCLCLGRPVVLLKEFNPVEFVQVLVNEKIADVVVVPAMLLAIMHHVPDLDQYDFSHLEKIVYGASPITVDVLQRAMDTFKCGFQQGFGMTEMCAAVTVLTVADHERALAGHPHLLRSCGRAGAFAELKICDPETREELPVGEVGEIVVRAPYAMDGYSREPEKTAEVMVDGWYYTGDGGYLDEEGYLYIKDRIKDMIVSGGENVYPAEVENALMSHPEIADVAVIGVPDAEFGEAVMAVCVTQNGESADQDQLIEHCREQIAGYKVPKHYAFTGQLPRNASGKLLKAKLREQYS